VENRIAVWPQVLQRPAAAAAAAAATTAATAAAAARRLRLFDLVAASNKGTWLRNFNLVLVLHVLTAHNTQQTRQRQFTLL
jgi:hypothetical protein